MIRLAIFADIHGKFLLPFKLVNHYQNKTGDKIDWIIQCGDMGAFPSRANMDKATLRHAKNDRDELGFMDDFCQPNLDIQSFLDELDVSMLCVRGNHEDHAFLDDLESNYPEQAYFPIDCYQRVMVIKTGHLIELNATKNQDSETISLVGVGRIGDSKGRTHAQYIQKYEHAKLKQLIKESKRKNTDYDMLITHDKDIDSERGYGSMEIAELLNELAFSYQFHGHTGEPYHKRVADNGITDIIKIKELEFDSSGKLDTGCMLILEKKEDNFILKDVPINDIIGFMKNTWRFM